MLLNKHANRRKGVNDANTQRWRRVQEVNHGGRMVQRRKSRLAIFCFVSIFIALCYAVTRTFSSGNLRSSTPIETDNIIDRTPTATIEDKLGMKHFGIHQTLELEVSETSIPLVCHGKLFYLGKGVTVPNTIDVGKVIEAFTMEEKDVIKGSTKLTSCCTRCALDGICDSFTLINDLCVLKRTAPIDNDQFQVHQHEMEDPVVVDRDNFLLHMDAKQNEAVNTNGNIHEDEFSHEDVVEDVGEHNKQDTVSDEVADDYAEEENEVPIASTEVAPQVDDVVEEVSDDYDDTPDQTNDIQVDESSIVEDDDNNDSVSTDEDTIEADEPLEEAEDVVETETIQQTDEISDVDISIPDEEDLGFGSTDSLSSLSDNTGADPLQGIFDMEAINSARDFIAEHSSEVEDETQNEVVEEEDSSVFMEHLASPDTIKKLAQAQLETLLPPGDYLRKLGNFYQSKKNFFSMFRPLQQLYQLVEDTAEYYNSHRISKDWSVDSIVIGKSSEGKAIRTLEFGNAKRGKHVFLIGGLRGCDWTGPLSTLHVAVTLLGRYQTTYELLDNVRFHIVPVANPDGYTYSRRKSPSSARQWCKNRRVVTQSHGVFLENNWGTEGTSWGFGKSGKEGARRDDYQGPSAFSEPEVAALKGYFDHFTTGKGRVAVINVRCCNGVVTPAQPYEGAPPGFQVDKVANFLAKVLKVPESTDYSFNARKEPFSASNNGQMIDWLYGEANVDHAYAVEIKATGITIRKNRYQIEPEAFERPSRELEYATVFVAQQLLKLDVEGEETPPYESVSVGSAPSSKKKTKH